MSSKPILQSNNLSKTYERKIALSSLSLTVEKGELIALIGPSGTGKTTLLNILANIIPSDTGNFEVDGLPIQHYPSNRILAKKIGVIRQQFDLVGQSPVIHNVLAGRLGEWGFFKSLFSLVFPQDKDLALAALERVGLRNKVYEKTSNLSGGEQQRVALARLLVQHPEVILADEPVASLDPARAEDILSMLVKLVREEKQTLITSLHSVEYAKKYFTRIIALREGSIYFDSPSEEITDQMLLDLYHLKELE
ncbi:phosphonate transport system ATP-binding protein [Anaerosolibacter carboniphilus]|uniref:Phosphonate transport system ATP-binding protein n=1 Tax=Anaerosolibacter carboniphilus TaxID=1417629 RepID=A0A841KSD4_9FIRM|nr:ATP-binding cassette domain-containing protein [Anaerosolibacter carboniphilus]MBB6216301.1 phosphonate transport system ATP-binding protein [Anaerosolibacter carboniphilus]